MLNYPGSTLNCLNAPKGLSKGTYTAGTALDLFGQARLNKALRSAAAADQR
jgi:hypothetical protein